MEQRIILKDHRGLALVSQNLFRIGFVYDRFGFSQENAAFICPFQKIQTAEKSRFAGTAWPQKGYNFPFGDIHIDAFEDFLLAEAFVDIAYFHHKIALLNLRVMRCSSICAPFSITRLMPQ